jgi:peptidoglycan/LPS O-acetylase OafA/YrhL
VLTRLLSSSPLRFVGRIAYGLYVFHPIAYYVVFRRLASQPAAVRGLAGVLATFACALVSWYGMERYMIELKDKLAPQQARFPASALPMTAL